MNRFRFLFTLLLLPLALVACSDNGPERLDPEDYLGDYVLQTINGSALPQTVSLEGVNVQVNMAIASLDHDTDWGLNFEGVVGGTPQEIPFFGSYAISGNKLTLKVMDEDWENVIRTIKGSVQVEAETLTIVYNQYTLVFKRQPLPV